jgi:two-component system sensor kinase FixL
MPHVRAATANERRRLRAFFSGSTDHGCTMGHFSAATRISPHSDVGIRAGRNDTIPEQSLMPRPMDFRPKGHASRILAAIVESSDDAIIAKDLDGTVLTWNDGARRMYGYTADEMVGQSMARIIAPEHATELESILARIRDGERIEPYETERVAKDGRRLSVSLRVSPIRDEDGHIIGASAIARDITEQKRAEQERWDSEARWRAVAESAVDGIVLIDARGNIEAFNPGAERMFGYTEADVLGQNVNVLMPSPYHEEHDDYMRRHLATGEKKIIGIGREVTAQRKNGETFPVHLSVGELQLGGAAHFTGILHDLSARVRLEERLREQNALARLGEMAAVIAHEVKNPLTAVRGAVQVIGSRLPAGSKDVAITKEIVARLDALNGMIQDLLMFARTPHPKLAPVDLGSILRIVADLLSADPAFTRVRVDVDDAGSPAHGDAELLKIVFQNLIINAAHAMDGQGVVRTRVSEADGAITISIADEGPGIAPEIRERLFQPFQTTKARGTGLGLATAKRLVEAHAGTIGITCPPGGGTVVTIRIPAAAAVV